MAQNSGNLIIHCYTKMTTKQIPEFITKYCSFNDKGLFLEIIKMKIRVSTIINYSLRKRFDNETQPTTGKDKIKL